MKRLKYIIVAMLCFSLLLSGCVKTPEVPYNVYNGNIRTQDGVQIDTEAMTISFGEDAVLEYNNTELSLGGIVYDCSRLQDGDELYYLISEKEISRYDAHESVFMGTYRQPAFLSELNMDNSKLYVDGRSAASIVALKDATIACLGDSMTCGAGTTPGYVQYLPQLLGSKNVLNYGLRETTISRNMYTSSDSDYSFIFRSQLMDKDADIIIVLGCINDWLEGWEIEEELKIEEGSEIEIDSDALSSYRDTTYFPEGLETEKSSATLNTSSFRYNFRELCQSLKKNYPDALIYIFSSPETNPAVKTAQDLEGTQWEGNVEGYNRIGKKLSDYSAAMEEICAEEDIPFCSLTEILSWEVFDGEAQYSSSEKALLIAEKISDFILESF